jgi:hypothetical protein
MHQNGGIMMNNDQLFDELVRMKMQERSFGSPDAAWEKAERMLSSERKRKFAGWRLSALLCLLSALGGGITVYLLMRTSGEAIYQGGIAAVRTTTAAESYASRVPHGQLHHTPIAPTVMSTENTGATANEIISPDPVQPYAPLVANIAATGNEDVDAEYSQAQNASPDQTENKDMPENEAVSLTAVALPPSLAVLSAPRGTDSVSLSSLWHPELNHWSLQAGAAYTAPLFADHNGSASFSPVLGAGYTMWLNPAWSLQAGVRYSAITNVSNAHAVTVKEFSPGVFHYNESQLRQMHYVSLPFQLYRRVGTRHAFTAGYTLNFLVAAQQRTSSYTETNGVIGNASSGKSLAPSSLSRFDGLFSAGYAFTLNRRVQLEASAYSGVTDLLHNSSYGNRFERNRGVLFLVQYSF